MRTKVLTLLIAVLLSVGLLAGCLGGSDENEEEDPNVDGGNETPDDGGQGSGDEDETEGGDEEEPAPPEEEETPEDFTTTVNLNVDAGATVGEEQAKDSAPFTVEHEGWSAFTIDVTPGDVNSNSVTVTVYDPEGNAAGSASFSFGDEEPQTIDVSSSAAGEYTIEAVAEAVSGGAAFTCDVTVTY